MIDDDLIIKPNHEHKFGELIIPPGARLSGNLWINVENEAEHIYGWGNARYPLGPMRPLSEKGDNK